MCVWFWFLQPIETNAVTMEWPFSPGMTISYYYFFLFLVFFIIILNRMDWKRYSLSKITDSWTINLIKSYKKNTFRIESLLWCWMKNNREINIMSTLWLYRSSSVKLALRTYNDNDDGQHTRWAHAESNCLLNELLTNNTIDINIVYYVRAATYSMYLLNNKRYQNNNNNKSIECIWTSVILSESKRQGWTVFASYGLTLEIKLIS